MRMKSRSWRLRAVVVAGVIAVCAPAGNAARRGRFAASHFGVVAFDLDEPAPEKLGALGVGVVRGSCDWPALEPARGVFDWTCADNVIISAERLRLRSYMTVNCTPAWASNGVGCGTLPRDMTDWYRFVGQFVARYSRYHTVLGVWNEPNLILRDDPDGMKYALLFINASNARNAVDPGFALAGPEVSHHALASGYFGRVMEIVQTWRALNPQDIIAVHWYPDGPPILPYLDAVHDAADRHEVWLSEIGYSTPDGAAQAGFYESMLDTFATSSRPWWTHLIIYRLWDGRDCCSEALLTGDYRNKPAFDAISRWLDMAPDLPESPYDVRAPRR
jgi:hypothetical protein